MYYTMLGRRRAISALPFFGGGGGNRCPHSPILMRFPVDPETFHTEEFSSRSFNVDASRAPVTLPCVDCLYLFLSFPSGEKYEQPQQQQQPHTLKKKSRNGDRIAANLEICPWWNHVEIFVRTANVDDLLFTLGDVNSDRVVSLTLSLSRSIFLDVRKKKKKSVYCTLLLDHLLWIPTQIAHFPFCVFP